MGATRVRARTNAGYNLGLDVVAVAQLVESQIVILVVVGSSPISHPINIFHVPPCSVKRHNEINKLA